MPNTFTEADLLNAVHPSHRARIRAMNPTARRRMAENVGNWIGRSRLAEGALPRTPTELQRLVSEAVASAVTAARPRGAPDEARRALQREANELRRTGLAGSDASALVMACGDRPDLASDAGYSDTDIAQIIRQHLTPTPRTGQLGRRPA